jgi:hypothetical protein
MKLFIKVVDGEAIDHPNLESNLLQAFPEGIPLEYEPFERKQNYLQPSVFQRVQVSYIKDETTNVWQDHWSIVDFTDAEKEEKTKELKAKIELRIENFKILAQNGIVECMKRSDVNGTNAFTDYLEILNSYKLVSVLPVSPPIPPVPLKGDDGYWYSEINSNPLFNVPYHVAIERMKEEPTLGFSYEASSILP